MKPIIFFDGICGLCNSFVTKTLKRDINHTFRFAPLQGKAAKKYLKKNKIDTIAVYTKQKTYERSNAVIYIYHHLGGIFACASLLAIIPRPLRDLVYNFVANNRYSWFGKRKTCRLPTKEEKKYFLK